jgi:hypothetical protein
VDAHTRLLADGFWLSRATVQGTVRMHRDLAERVGPKSGLSVADITERVRPSPGWIEARYLRRADRLAKHEDRRSLILLAVFALLDEQYGFAIDVADQLRAISDGERVADALAEHALATIRRSRRRRTLRQLPPAVGRRLRSVIGPR